VGSHGFFKGWERIKAEGANIKKGSPARLLEPLEGGGGVKRGGRRCAGLRPPKKQRVEKRKERPSCRGGRRWSRCGRGSKLRKKGDNRQIASSEHRVLSPKIWVGRTEVRDHSAVKKTDKRKRTEHQTDGITSHVVVLSGVLRLMVRCTILQREHLKEKKKEIFTGARQQQEN